MRWRPRPRRDSGLTDRDMPQVPDVAPAPRAGRAQVPAAAGRAIILTLAGMWWERLARHMWPAASAMGAGFAALALGGVAALPPVALPVIVGAWALLVVVLTLWGARRFVPPQRRDAADRVDRSLPGRPLSALADRMVLGGAGDGALWRAHQDAARRQAGSARPVAPAARLAARDPFALRLAALTATVMAVIFGGAGPAGQGLAALAGAWRPPVRPETPAVNAGPAWEGWSAPPAYTRRPTIYLNALKGDALTLPEGSRISFRLYGEGLSVAQDIGPAADGASAGAPAFMAAHPGTIRIGDRQFAIQVIPDAAPAVALSADAERRADGRLVQPFTATDDNGIATGQAHIALHLAAVDRRYGLAADPEPREPLALDLPLAGAGQRRDVRGALSADLSRHPWANLPVTVTLRVADGIGQTAESPARRMILPGRRFFDPLAAALVEMRRDLLWSAANAPRSAQILRAAVWGPVPDNMPPDAARAIVDSVKTLEAAPLTPAARDGVAEKLWTAAVAIEDGGLSDALARMQQAQQRLSEAIRGGASPDEIRKLMEELKAAADAYTDMLAQKGGDPAQKFDRSPRQQGQEITGDQIQQMMDEIERLMNQGRMAEAQEVLEQFNRMMQNLQVSEGEGQGEGRTGRSMQQLGDTLREQQRLADDALREAQRDPFNLDPNGQQDGGQQNGGQQGGQDQSQQNGTAPAPQGDPQSLADRQRELREALGRQRGLLPGRGTPEGAEAGRQIDDAGRAMEEAERALRDGDRQGAMERQADAIASMREGLRALGDLARGQQGAQQPGAGETPGDQGRSRAQGGQGRPSFPQTRRDPLGRDSGGQGSDVTTGEPLADAQDGQDRARDLQDEIRRRSGEASRPRDERDYLGRLLKD